MSVSGSGEAVCICWDAITLHPVLGWIHVATGKRGCLGLPGAIARPREEF